MSTTHVAFTIAGLALDVTGGCLIAAAELVPRAAKIRTAATRRASAVGNRVRAVLRIRRDVVLHIDAATATATMSGRLSAVHGVGPDATLDRKLAFLLQHAEDAQNRLNELERQIVDVPAALREEAEATKAALEASIAEHLKRSEARYSRQRFWGLILVVFGGVAQAIANLT